MPRANKPKKKPIRKAPPVKRKKPIQTSRAAKKGWETRRKNAHSQAAKKGWETRRKKARSQAAKKGWETRRQTAAVKVVEFARELQPALVDLEQARKRAANARGLPEHALLREEQRQTWLHWRRGKRIAKRQLSPNGKPTMSEAFAEVVRRIGRKLGLSNSLIESYITS